MACGLVVDGEEMGPSGNGKGSGGIWPQLVSVKRWRAVVMAI